MNARDFLLYVISELKENENRNSNLTIRLVLFFKYFYNNIF